VAAKDANCGGCGMLVSAGRSVEKQALTHQSDLRLEPFLTVRVGYGSSLFTVLYLSAMCAFIVGAATTPLAAIVFLCVAAILMCYVWATK
jgi:hypothetical protein